MTKQDEDGFLERWSRRKRGDSSDGDLGTEAAEAPPLSEANTAESDTAESDAGDPEVIAKLPDLDSLTGDTDFTVFLQDGVPEAMRRQALRKLWRLNPVFAHLDGLNDYDEDFSALGIIAENIKTIYKVGKGYLDNDDEEEEVAEVEAGAEAEAGAENEDEIAERESPDAEADAESESHAAPDSDTPESDGPLDATDVSEMAPEAESNLKKPVPGSALARRWGGRLDNG